MKTALVVATWAVTLTAAFVVGRISRAEVAETNAGRPHDAAATNAELEKRVEELTRALRETRDRTSRAETRSTSRRAAPEEPAAAAATTEPLASAVDPTVKFALDDALTGPEISERLRTFIDVQLGRGEDGYTAVLDAINVLWRDDEARKRLFRPDDEAAMARELFPWVRMLVRHEDDAVGLAEFVFRTMAEKPEFFADTPDDDVLEIFTEGFGILLPGAVSKERMAILRAYAVKVLATPEEKQPKALQGNRSRIERLLQRFWSVPVTSDQALARLAQDDLTAHECAALVQALDSDARSKVDLTGLVAKFLRAGDEGAIALVGTPAFGPLDMAILDHAFLGTLDAGSYGQEELAQYVRRSRRRTWTDLRPLFESALGLGPKAVETTLAILAHGLLPDARPDPAYVEELLRRVTMPEETANELRARYGIK